VTRPGVFWRLWDATRVSMAPLNFLTAACSSRNCDSAVHAGTAVFGYGVQPPDQPFHHGGGTGCMSRVFADNWGRIRGGVCRKLGAFHRLHRAAGGPKNFDIRVPLSRPFLYDPAKAICCWNSELHRLADYQRDGSFECHQRRSFAGVCRRSQAAAAENYNLSSGTVIVQLIYSRVR